MYFKVQMGQNMSQDMFIMVMVVAAALVKVVP
jgi:hypothetical protein